MSSANQNFDLVALTAQIVQISSPTGFIEPINLPGLPGGSIPVVVIPGSGAQQIPIDTTPEIAEDQGVGVGQVTAGPGLTYFYATVLGQANSQYTKQSQ